MMSRVEFNEEEHKYSIEGRELISSTRFIGQFFKAFDVNGISKRVALARRKKGELGPKGKPITARDVKKEWKHATDMGTHVHMLIEKYIKRVIGMEDIDNVKAFNGVQFFDRLTRGLNKPHVDTEKIIYSEKLGIAGMIDVMITHQNADNPSERYVTLLDWKTNKKLDIKKDIFKRGGEKTLDNVRDDKYSRYTLQLSLYAYMLELIGYKINNLIVVHLQEDKVVPTEVTYEKAIVSEMIQRGKVCEEEYIC
jgi:hypothetical protein